MLASIAELAASALQLAPKYRAQRADRLLASLSADPDLGEAWSVEAERRLSALENGRVIGVPIADAIARARNAIK